jgi:hypothetical protein
MAEVILIIVIPNVACGQSNKPVKWWNSKEVCVHTVKRMYSFARRWIDIITLKDLLEHQNIELLPEPYFHVVLLYR